MSTSDNTKSMPSIAVVICTHNRPIALEHCLRQLQQINRLGCSVVVADSAPASSDAQKVADRHNVQYVISPLKGLSRARNIGTRSIDADIIAYLDDDMLPHAYWLESLVAEFEDENVMAVTGPVLPLELFSASDFDLELAIELKPWGPHHFQIDNSSREWFERTNFGGAGDGNFALRRSAFDRMRGFDERLGRGAMIDSGEEHYAFFRLVDLRFRIAYAPRAIVFHPRLSMNHDVLRKQISDAVAYAAFLAWNHPSKSWRVVRFLVEGAVNTQRWWHTSWKFEMTSLSAKQKVASGINGLSVFFRSLRQTSM